MLSESAEIVLSFCHQGCKEGKIEPAEIAEKQDSVTSDNWGKNSRRLGATQESANLLLFFPYFSGWPIPFFLLLCSLLPSARETALCRPPRLQHQGGSLESVSCFTEPRRGKLGNEAKFAYQHRFPQNLYGEKITSTKDFACFSRKSCGPGWLRNVEKMPSAVRRSNFPGKYLVPGQICNFRGPLKQLRMTHFT